MTNKLALRFSLLCLALAIGELICLAWLIPLDAVAYRWVQTLRSCRLDSIATLLKQLPITMLIILGSLPILVLYVRRQWAAAWHMSWVILGGAFLCELLKTGLERARPSVLTPTLVGNSFPSGHISTALLLTGVFVFLGLRYQWPPWLHRTGSLFFFLLSAFVTWQRLYLGHHWLLDVVGTLLLTGAWLSFSLSRPARPVEHGVSRSALALSLGLLVSYPIFFVFPDTRLWLPSVRAVARPPVVRLSFGTPTRHATFHGAWGKRDREPAGPIIWMQRGDASVTIRLPERTAYLLAFAARPFVHTKTETCYPVSIFLNGHQVGQQLLYRGWREYELWLDSAWVTPGKNDVTFRVGPDFPPAGPEHQTVAFRDLRVLR